MKKILILFLLSFPILIFTIVTLTSSVISYYVPLAVEGIEMIEGGDISDDKINKDHNLSFQIYPKNARDMSFKIRDENNVLIVDYDQDEGFQFNNNEDNIVILESGEQVVKDGYVSLNVKTNNIGFTRLTIMTRDGNFQLFSDVMVIDNTLDPSEIQGVVLDYNSINKEFLFGNKNAIDVGFTYFPKTAINISDEDLRQQINEQLKANALKLEFESVRGKTSNLVIESYGRGKITIEPYSNTYEGVMSLSIETEKVSSFDFNLTNGYNVVREEELFQYKDLGTNLFILNHISLNNLITFNNGTSLYGNNFQIDHSNLKEYKETDDNGKIMHVGKKAITMVGHNSGLYDIHIIGALDSNNQPYENITNVQMDAAGSNDKLMNVNNVIIENGRYNLSVRGKVISMKDDPTVFNLDQINLVGAYLASFEIDNHSYALTDALSTTVNLSRMHISYTAIGILIQNNRNSNPSSHLNLIEKAGVNALISTSWRNLDDASGALSNENFGYILSELKSDEYKDIYYKQGKDYYVNPVIMLRGGGKNRSTINFEQDSSLDLLIKKERKPKGMIEVGVVGGTHPFILYMLNPSEYERKSI